MSRTATLVPFIFFTALGVLVTSVGIYEFIVYPLLTGEHYDYSDEIILENYWPTKAMTVSLNSSDTLFYRFETDAKIAFWVEDPAGNLIRKPAICGMSSEYYEFNFVAKSTGVYKIVFSRDVPNMRIIESVKVRVESGVVPGKPATTN